VQLTEKEITVELTASARRYLAEKGYDPVMGARPMARLFQDTLRDLVTDAIIDEKVSGGETVTMDFTDGQIVISNISKSSKAEPAQKKKRSRAANAKPKKKS
jgi:ATP-dependent Clp protease ATP-binding subunit ClpA